MRKSKKRYYFSSRPHIHLIFAMVLALIFLAQLSWGEGGTTAGEEVEEKNYTITSKIFWNDTTIFARSIEIKATGVLIIENSSIIMNNTAESPDFINNGQLIMNGSELLPLEYDIENRYTFRSHGPCVLTNNEIFQPESVALFTNDVELRYNTIWETKLDGVYIRGDNNTDATPLIFHNTIMDAELNGFHFVDAIVELHDDRVLGARFDAFYIQNSGIHLWNCEVEDIERYRVAIGEDSTLDIHPETNILEKDIVFLDSTSVVRIHTKDDVIVLQPSGSSGSSSSFLSSRMKIILFVCLVVAGIIVSIFLDRWYGKNMKKRKLFIPSVEVGEAGKETGEPIEDIDDKKAGVQEEFGDMALDGGSYEAAIEYYDRALSLNERRDEILVKKGSALEKMGRHQEAFQCYVKALRVNRRNDEALKGKERYDGLITSINRTGWEGDGEEKGSSVPSGEEGSGKRPMARRPGKKEEIDDTPDDESSGNEEEDLFPSTKRSGISRIHGIGLFRKRMTKERGSKGNEKADTGKPIPEKTGKKDMFAIRKTEPVVPDPIRLDQQSIEGDIFTEEPTKTEAAAPPPEKEPAGRTAGISKEVADEDDIFGDQMGSTGSLEDDGKEEWKDKRMDKGIDKRMDKGIDKRIDKGMEKRIDKGMEKRIDKGMEKRIDKGMEKRIDKGMEKRIDKGIKEGSEIEITEDSGTRVQTEIAAGTVTVPIKPKLDEKDDIFAVLESAPVEKPQRQVELSGPAQTGMKKEKEVMGKPQRGVEKPEGRTEKEKMVTKRVEPGKRDMIEKRGEPGKRDMIEKRGEPGKRDRVNVKETEKQEPRKAAKKGPTSLIESIYPQTVDEDGPREKSIGNEFNDWISWKRKKNGG